ncbi:hypothetical protein AB0B01_04080 [Streptomyces sp. NPDC044571]|uniref:hypothetical protein n=1 Tax=Streptomyces sp. NPDC044571 TaxID=3155371 RepID=UPI0034111346
MATQLPGSRQKSIKQRYGGALAVVAAVLMLAACDPGAAGTDTPSASPSTGISADVAIPSAAPAPPSPSSSPTPSPEPTTAAPAGGPGTAAPVATEPAAPPTPTRARTSAPAPEPEPTQAKEDTGCYPLSNAGNCYKAGQICRKADVGTTGRDANGRTIHCRHDDSVGQRWGY